MPAPYTKKGSCRWKQWNYGGIVGVGYCTVCVQHDAMSNTDLRRKEKTGDVQINGACLNKTIEEAAIDG
jgi:hypothetical protein